MKSNFRDFYLLRMKFVVSVFHFKISSFKFRKVCEFKVFELLHETIWRVFHGINQRNVDNHRSSWVCPKLEFVVGPCSWVMSAIILFCLWCGQWAAVVNCCQTKLSANSAADWLRPLLILSYSALTQTTHTEKKRGETKQVSSRTPTAAGLVCWLLD